MAAPEPTMRSAEVVDDLGNGPPVVLLHGVGFGPDTLAPIASALAERARVLVVRRPTPTQGAALRHHAAATAVAVDEHLGGQGFLVAGASGGATLALAVPATGAPVLGVVAHEPLLGSFAPDLADQVRSAHTGLAAGTLDPMAWFAGLVGATAWHRLEEGQRTAALAAHHDLLVEAAPFVDWEPTDDDLAALRALPVLVTVGDRSSAARHLAAAAAHRLVGATVDVLPGTGHLVQLDAPGAFVAAVESLLHADR